MTKPTKTARVELRLTVDQLKRFQRAAAAKKKTVSQWIRDILNAAS